jgi:hypothetical protein
VLRHLYETLDGPKAPTPHPAARGNDRIDPREHGIAATPRRGVSGRDLDELERL